MNEPKSICLYSYGSTSSAPGLNLIGDGVYECAKVHLLAHAKAWHIYDEEFRASQGGKVSLVLDSPWNEPASDSDLDVWAAERETIFGVNCFTITTGFYNFERKFLAWLVCTSSIFG